jgi:hypothetical protein
MAKFCTNCGTELDPSWRTCPNCGSPLDDSISQASSISQPTVQAPPPSYAPTYAKTYSTGTDTNYGAIALVFGLIGLFCGGILFGIIAIIVGAIGISRDTNTSIAAAGLILGILDVVCSLIFLISFTSFFWFWYL